MRVRLGLLKQFIREGMSSGRNAGGNFEFTFPVYGPSDETIEVHCVYNPRTPYEVEIWKATDESGEEVDLDALGQQQDLHAKAMEFVGENLPDMDPPGTGFDDRY